MTRAPYSFEGRGMHPESESSIDNIERCREWAKQENVWVVATHDATIARSIFGKEGAAIEGVVCLDGWKERDWKKPQV